MRNVYVISDEHYFDASIIGFCKRPFDDVLEMNAALINRHNSVVKPTDHTIHVGDLAWMYDKNLKDLRSIISKLNGTHELVLGNHDELRPEEYIKAGISLVHTALVLDYKGKKLIFAHDPAIWTAVHKHKNTIFICGHIHKLFKILRKEQAVNVSADVLDYRPILLDEIIKIFE